MSVNNEPQNYTGGATIEKTLPQNGVYASLFNKINLTPVAEIGDLNSFEDNTVMAETSADARVTAAVQVFMQCLQKSGQKVEKLDKTLLDHHIAELDSRHVDHVTEANSTRNVIRTAGLNKLRMEDKRGEEHIKLSTEYGGKTQLNLGHNVDADRVLRGEGAELRTDKWVAVRGGAGVFITADKQPFAGDKMLSMQEAIAQLENALSIARSLSDAAETAQALPADIQSQVKLTDALKDLAQPGMVLNAPEGVSITSPQAVRMASGSASVGIMSQQNTDISALKRFTVAAGEAVSMLARKAGMKLFAAKGKVEIQAQDDALEAIAKKDVTVTSVEGKVVITGATELVVNCGGAFMKLSGGNMELGAPGNILLKCANVQKMGSADYDVPKPVLPQGYSERFVAQDKVSGDILANTRYRITTADGSVYEGRTDSEGKTAEIFGAAKSKISIELLGG